MMLILRALLMTMMVSGGIVFGMEKEHVEFEFAEQLQCMPMTQNGMPDLAIATIKDFAKNHVRLTRVLNNKKGAEQVLDFVAERCPCFWREGQGIGCRDRQGFYKELAAAVLGTPGAIEFGKEYIKDNDEAQQRLRMFLSNIVLYGREDNGYRYDGFIFSNEGVDIIKAGLDILIDSQIKNDLLVRAARANKVKVAELLLDRKANINMIDYSGRTPLIIAAMYGYIDIVKKLLVAKAVVWLIDGYDKCALDYAQECLSDALSKDKEKYEMIVQLLKDVK